jgi:two-component system KDP operon response regulator KdpE
VVGVSRVLVIDDEPQIVRALTINLRARGYEVATAGDAHRALTLAAQQPPDLILPDLGLPDMDGMEVIAGLRGWTTAPIIVLSGRSDPTDKIGALDAGADDYVTKPFSIGELLARLRAAERRSSTVDEPRVQLGEYSIDLATHAIDGPAEVRLTPTEWHLLEILLRNPGKLITQRQLLTEVWGPAFVKETHYLRMYLGRIRRKLEPDPSRPRQLITEPGMGYRFQPLANDEQ